MCVAGVQIKPRTSELHHTEMSDIVTHCNVITRSGTELDLHIAGVQIKQCDHTELDLHIAGVQIKPRTSELDHTEMSDIITHCNVITRSGTELDLHIAGVQIKQCDHAKWYRARFAYRWCSDKTM